MPRRKRVPPKPVHEDTVVIEHDDDVGSDSETLSSSSSATDAALEACSLLNESEDVIAILKRSRSTNPVERKAALRSMCPCKVKREIDPFWVRIVEMCNDPDDSVRYQVLHSLCDGSPASLEELVAETVRSFWNDPSDKIKRAARRAYNSWQRGDGINIL
jgi:vesicle coat complex subunit